MDASRARSIYEEIVRRQRDPALVEWMGYGMLRARIFPILPGEEKRVVVRFDQVAQREGDAMRVDYVRGSMPMVNRRAPRSHASRRREQREVAFISYFRTEFMGAVLSDELIIDVSDGGVVNVLSGDSPEITLLIPLRRSSSASISVLANRSGRDDGFALITLAPPPDCAGNHATRRHVRARRERLYERPKDGASACRWTALLTTLSPRDRFRLIDFSTDVRTFRGDFEVATRENVRAAQLSRRAHCQGATNIAGALEEALRDGQRGARRHPGGYPLFSSSPMASRPSVSGPDDRRVRRTIARARASLHVRARHRCERIAARAARAGGTRYRALRSTE